MLTTSFSSSFVPIKLCNFYLLCRNPQSATVQPTTKVHRNGELQSVHSVLEAGGMGKIAVRCILREEATSLLSGRTERVSGQ
jgi:hypothetical protein